MYVVRLTSNDSVMLTARAVRIVMLVRLNGLTRRPGPRPFTDTRINVTPFIVAFCLGEGKRMTFQQNILDDGSLPIFKENQIVVHKNNFVTNI